MIQTSDIKFYLSAPQATSGYTLPGSPGNSNGNFISTTQLSTLPLNNLFPDITGAQNAADQVDYTCLFIYNSNAADTMLNPVAWLPNSLLGGSNGVVFAIAPDPTSPSALMSGTAQALAIQSSVQAPAGISVWYAPTQTATGGAPLPNIPALTCMAVWIRRTCNGTGGQNVVAVEVNFNSLA